MLPFIFRDQEEAQGLLEYALIMLLIAVFAIASLGLLGTTVFEFLDGFAQQISGLGSD